MLSLIDLKALRELADSFRFAWPWWILQGHLRTEPLQADPRSCGAKFGMLGVCDISGGWSCGYACADSCLLTAAWSIKGIHFGRALNSRCSVRWRQLG